MRRDSGTDTSLTVKDDLTILVVDDEACVRRSFETVLKGRVRLLLAENGARARIAFQQQPVDLILLEVLLPDDNGMVLLDHFKSADPDVEVVMVTAVNDVDTVVAAMKRGAHDYVIKPFGFEQIITVVDHLRKKRLTQRGKKDIHIPLPRTQIFEGMVGRSKCMQDIFNLIESVATSTGSVLIQGDSGTGKEMVAKAIHKCSPRAAGPFVVVNCATIPGTLAESELFGHTLGAFTGATQARKGKLEVADKGTVFFDDIDSLDVITQAKLLRVIQEKEFYRVGSNRIIHVDVRFIAASNKDLEELIAANHFRQDLYYRLNIFPIGMPPLRDRKVDIPLLLDHFMKISAKAAGGSEKQFSPRARSRLKAYSWPGNVRELKNLVERVFTLIRGDVIRVGDIDIFNSVLEKHQIGNLKTLTCEFQKHHIKDVLECVNGKRKEAARILGIHRNTLLAKMKIFGIDGLCN